MAYHLSLAGEELLGVVVPAFVRFLITDSSSAEPNQWRKMLHKECLDQLMKIGPLYPAVSISCENSAAS
jgi:hypothetical protein